MMAAPGARILIRGGGDLATGVAVRLWRAGFHPVVIELGQPLAIRREVSFAEAVYRGAINVEGVRAERAASPLEASSKLASGIVPVLIDPGAVILEQLDFLAVVDARMRKNPAQAPRPEPFLIGLGPGFMAGLDCDAVVETNRGHALGRVILEGSAEADTGLPEAVLGFEAERVLRALDGGVLSGGVPIGTVLEAGAPIATIAGQAIMAPFRGVLRGLIHDGLRVAAGDKIGDLDPRAIPDYAFQVSDKALAVAGGVLEALLSQPAIRTRWASHHAAEG
jgi:xanthine dehydrogenase accessory factor